MPDPSAGSLDGSNMYVAAPVTNSGRWANPVAEGIQDNRDNAVTFQRERARVSLVHQT